MRQVIPCVITTVIVMALPISATAADTIVTCKNPRGYANYHPTDLIPKQDSEFAEDQITGPTTLVRLSQNDYDLLHTDARQEAKSSRHDGATVKLLRRGKSDAMFLVVYPNSVEINTFFKDTNGSEKFSVLTSRAGDLPIHKSSVMVGNCSGLNLNLLN